MSVAIASDHGGYNLKSEIIKFLEKESVSYRDFGTYSADSVDYPDYALPVAEAVKSGEFERGILCCGTGIGISIAANKVPGIRAALCHDTFSARASREHNNANILALGERVLGVGPALEIVRVWLEAGFDGGRHATRLEKISLIEKKYCGVND